MRGDRNNGVGKNYIEFSRQVKFGALEGVKQAKVAGLNINAIPQSGKHILHACIGASNANKTAILECLVSLPGIKFDMKDKDGNTALDIAITNQDAKCVDILHKKGCTVKQENEKALNALLEQIKQDQQKNELGQEKAIQQQQQKNGEGKKSSNHYVSFSRIIFPMIPSIPFFFYSADPKYISCFSAGSYIVSLPCNASISSYLKLSSFYLGATGVNAYSSINEDWRLRVAYAAIANIMILSTLLYSAFGMQDDIAR